MCGISRIARGLFRFAGFVPVVMDYLAIAPSRSRLVDLIAASVLSLRAAIRQYGMPFEVMCVFLDCILVLDLFVAFIYYRFI
ncbi:hypothetical protein AAGG49_22125, partial [Stenotrophomonas maltophilia]